MITFILQDFITITVLSFTVGLYVGAFIQHRRENTRFSLAQKMLKSLLDDKKIKRVDKDG